MDIKQHILTLISQEEMAYVPNLGGIMSKQTTARLDTSTHIFYPPTKELAFNDRMVTSDSKLANLISQEEGCSLNEAEEKIASFVASMKNELSVHHKYTLEDIGTFYFTEQGLVSFQSKLTSVADTYNFGLPSILINNFIKEETNKKIFSKPKDRNAMSTLDLQSVPDPASPGDNPPRTRPGKNEPATSSLTWLYVLTPIVLLGLFGIFLGITEDGKKMLSSMTAIGTQQEDSASSQTPTNELETATETAVVTQDSTPIAIESFDNAVSAEETIKKSEKEIWGEEPTKSKQEVIAKSEEATYSTANIITGKSGRYFIIIGGFSKKKNAVKLREKLINEGLESKVLAPMEDGGLYRVSLADYDNLQAALKKADELKASHGDNLWVKSY